MKLIKAFVHHVRTAAVVEALADRPGRAPPPLTASAWLRLAVRTP